MLLQSLLKFSTCVLPQAAAAASLSLMAARDPVVQDSVRYLGGLDLLVALLVAPSARVAEAAR